MPSKNFWNMYDISGREVALLFFTFLLSLPAFGQYNINDRDAKKASQGYSFGLHFGVTRHTYRIDHSEFFNQQTDILAVEGDKNMGVDFGLIGVLHPLKQVEIRTVPTLNFSTRNITYTRAGVAEPEIQKLEFSSFDLPLYAKFKSKPYNDFRMFFIGGGKYSIDLGSNKEQRNLDDVVKLEKNNFYAEGGVGAEFHFDMFTLAPEIKISQGILNQRVPNEALDLSAVLSGLYSRVYSLSINIE